MTTLAVLVVALIAAVIVFVMSVMRRTPDPLEVGPTEAAVRRSLWRHPRVLRFVRERLDRNAAGGLMVTIAIGVVFVIALVFGLLLDLVDRNDTVASIDASVSKWGSRNASSEAVAVLKVITELGSTWFSITLLMVASVVAYVRQRNTSVFAFVAIVGLGELLINNVLKLVVDRDRPSVLRLVGASGMSFPSGHSAAAAAAWSAAALLVSRDRHRAVRAALGATAALIAVAVATSRALLGVHWVTDVIAGLLLGWGWFFIVAVIFGGRRQRFGDPVADQVASSPDTRPDEQQMSTR